MRSLRIISAINVWFWMDMRFISCLRTVRANGSSEMVSWSKIRTKYVKSASYELLAILVILLAVVLRIVLVALGWPQLDSDEGTIGIMGMHILFRGEHPIFFYAQGYMGAMEAYLAAAMFALFGVSTFALRFGLILLFALFLIGMYLLTSWLYTKKWAVITLCFLCLGSSPILTRELVAIGGFSEKIVLFFIIHLLSFFMGVLFCGTIILFLSWWLCSV